MMRNYFYVLSVLIILLSLLLLSFYGYSFYVVLANRSGMNGHIYTYYAIGRWKYLLYIFLVAALALSFILFIITGLVKSNTRLLNKSFWLYLLFIALLAFSEWILNGLWIGKG